MIHQPTVILKPEMVQIAKTARVDSFCKIEGGEGVELGENVHIASFSHLNVGGGVTIFEEESCCSSGCRIGSATPDWGYLYISACNPSMVKRLYKTVIHKYAILFMGVTVVPGVEFGEGAIALPGSVVVGDVAPWTIVQGNPARPVGQRNLYEADRRLLLSQFRLLSGKVLRPDAGVPDPASEELPFCAVDFGVWGLD